MEHEIDVSRPKKFLQANVSFRHVCIPRITLKNGAVFMQHELRLAKHGIDNKVWMCEPDSLIQ